MSRKPTKNEDAADALFEVAKHARLPKLLHIVMLLLATSDTTKIAQIGRMAKLCVSRLFLARAVAKIIAIIIALRRLRLFRVYVWNPVLDSILRKWKTTLQVDAKDPHYNDIMAYVVKEKLSQAEALATNFLRPDTRTRHGNICPEGNYRFRRKYALVFVDVKFENLSYKPEIIDLVAIGPHPLEALRDFLEFCRTLAKDERRKNNTKKIKYYEVVRTSHQGGIGWGACKAINGRSIDTVYLSEEKKNKIIAAVSKFWTPKYEAEMKVVSLPHRLGYIFHGRPGTGKTSMVQAIATEYEVSILPILLGSPLLNDDNINSLFQNLPTPKCIVLLEDIDCCHDGREGRGNNKDGTKGEKMSNVSYSALLNVIDGVGAAEGRLLIITTNFPERLDEALIRKGRCDDKIEFGCASRTDALRMFLNMYLR